MACFELAMCLRGFRVLFIELTNCFFSKIDIEN